MGPALLVAIALGCNGASSTTSEDAAPAPGSNVDPRDDAPASLDVATSQLFFDGASPWVRVTFFGAWPPSKATYAWACAVVLGTENAPSMTFTRFGDEGVTTDVVEGLDASKVVFADEPRGFRVRFAEPNLAFDRYGIECSVQETSTSPTASDTSGAFPVGERSPRAFGP